MAMSLRRNGGYKSDARFEIIEFDSSWACFMINERDEFYTVSIEECISEVPNLSSNFNHES